MTPHTRQRQVDRCSPSNAPHCTSPDGSRQNGRIGDRVSQSCACRSKNHMLDIGTRLVLAAVFVDDVGAPLSAPPQPVSSDLSSARRRSAIVGFYPITTVIEVEARCRAMHTCRQTFRRS